MAYIDVLPQQPNGLRGELETMGLRFDEARKGMQEKAEQASGRPSVRSASGRDPLPSIAPPSL
jgi:hypothetical protein